MAAYSPRPAAEAASAARRSIDDLDAEICSLARHMNAETYRLLVLVREFDDRFGWAKWGLRNCAEWLAWRCGLSLSAAREKVRTAQALRGMPATSAAFADGVLSYSKSSTVQPTAVEMIGRSRGVFVASGSLVPSAVGVARAPSVGGGGGVTVGVTVAGGVLSHAAARATPVRWSRTTSCHSGPVG